MCCPCSTDAAHSNGGADRVASKFIPVFARAAVGRSCGGSGPSCFTEVPWGVASSPGSTVSLRSPLAGAVEAVGIASAGTTPPPAAPAPAAAASPPLKEGAFFAFFDDAEDAQDEAGEGSAVRGCASPSLSPAGRDKDGTTAPSPSPSIRPRAWARGGSDTSNGSAARVLGELTPGMQLHHAGKAPVVRTVPSPLKGSSPPSPREPEEEAGEVRGGEEHVSDAADRPCADMGSFIPADSVDTPAGGARLSSFGAKLANVPVVIMVEGAPPMAAARPDVSADVPPPRGF